MKRSKKKLNVNKETVRPLTPEEAQQADGGVDFYVIAYPKPQPKCTYVATTCTDAGR